MLVDKGHSPVLDSTSNRRASQPNCLCFRRLLVYNLKNGKAELHNKKRPRCRKRRDKLSRNSSLSAVFCYFLGVSPLFSCRVTSPPLKNTFQKMKGFVLARETQQKAHENQCSKMQETNVASHHKALPNSMPKTNQKHLLPTQRRSPLWIKQPFPFTKSGRGKKSERLHALLHVPSSHHISSTASKEVLFHGSP